MAERHGCDACWCYFDGKVMAACEGLELIEECVTLLGQLGDCLTAAACVVLALESTRDVSLCRLQKAIEVGGEFASFALRQADRVRPVRLVKIVDVDPVRRRGPGRCKASQEVLDGTLTARPSRASDEEIVAL